MNEAPRELYVDQKKPGKDIEANFIKGSSEQTGYMLGVLLERYLKGEITREEVKKKMEEDIESNLFTIDGMIAKKKE